MRAGVGDGFCIFLKSEFFCTEIAQIGQCTFSEVLESTVSAIFLELRPMVHSSNTQKFKSSLFLFHNSLRFVELCSFYFLNTLWNTEN